MALNSRYLINVCPSNNPCAGISYPHSLIFGSCINTAVCPISLLQATARIVINTWQNLASMVELCHAGFWGKICQHWNKVALLGREVLAVILVCLLSLFREHRGTNSFIKVQTHLDYLSYWSSFAKSISMGVESPRGLSIHRLRLELP